MQKSEGPSAVALQARLPTSETISIEAEASEEMKNVKQRIASLGGLNVDSFTLTFDGEVVGEDSDGRLLENLPFGDGSMFEVVVSKKQAALHKLSEMGAEVKGENLCEMLTCFKKEGGPRAFSWVLEGSEIEEEKLCEIVNLLLDAGVSGGEEEALSLMAQLSLPSCVEALLTRTSVDVNSAESPTHFGDYLGQGTYVNRTALHRATEEEVAAVLLRHKADVNVKDSIGFPLLYSAAKMKHPGGTLSILLKYNADVKVRNGRGATALHLESVAPSAVHLLLEHNADIEVKDRDGRTPLLQHCMGSGDAEIVRILLDHNADVGAKDNDGNTCLHHAVGQHRLELIPLLLRRNADLTEKNDEGATALDLICSDGRESTKAMRYLLQDPNLAHDLELFEGGTEPSDGSKIPILEMIAKQLKTIATQKHFDRFR